MQSGSWFFPLTPPPVPYDHLYLSDLDGTLLRPDATLSGYARTKLMELIRSGVAFSIATGRSIVSVREKLSDLPVHLPVICSNGAYISDLATGEHYCVHSIPADLSPVVLACIHDQGFYPVIQTLVGQDERMYIHRLENQGIRAFVHERMQAHDYRLRVVEDPRVALDESVLSMLLIDTQERLEALEATLLETFPGRLEIYLYKDWFFPDWHWMSVYEIRATKGNAATILAQELGLTCEQITVFGDEMNDVSMFRIAGRRIAPANANPYIKAMADEIIDTNEADAVVKYIAKVTGHP
ncbi:MAG: Cof-type HAD-IIB family hydrolase [Bacteroidia bacterium]|nr:Cof-type HAD-IIB family hydrolase [Bacteroidia bacterium]